MKSEFRDTSPQDAPAITAFLQRIWNISPDLPIVAPRHLYWKNWQHHPDWTGSRGYVITKEGAIVAHGTVVPLSYFTGEKYLKILQLIDWAADPKSVGSGVTLLKRMAQLVDAVLIIGGSDMTQKVLPALGFRNCGMITKFVRPLRPLRRIAGQKLAIRTGAQFARSLLWSLQARSVSTQGWAVRRISSPDLKSAGIPWPRSTNGAVVFERTPDNMAYLLECPATPVELFAVAKSGSVIGYFLLAHAPGQTRIADFYLDTEDQEDWRVLIQLAVLQARRNRDAAEVVSLGSDPVTCRVLTECGFHPRGAYALRILPAKGIDFPTGPVRVHMIDSDLAYLHANKSAYWA